MRFSALWTAAFAAVMLLAWWPWNALAILIGAGYLARRGADTAGLQSRNVSRLLTADGREFSIGGAQTIEQAGVLAHHLEAADQDGRILRSKHLGHLARHALIDVTPARQSRAAQRRNRPLAGITG